MSGISRDEWLHALTEAGLHQESDEQAITIHEFAAMFGLTPSAAKTRLRALVAQGKAKETHKRAAGRDGRVVPFRAYRLNERTTDKRKRA
jgi:predicted ArsR family transcriptional regulator